MSCSKTIINIGCRDCGKMYTINNMYSLEIKDAKCMHQFQRIDTSFPVKDARYKCVLCDTIAAANPNDLKINP